MENLLLYKRLALQMLIFDAGGLQIRQNWGIDACRAATMKIKRFPSGMELGVEY